MREKVLQPKRKRRLLIIRTSLTISINISLIHTNLSAQRLFQHDNQALCQAEGRRGACVFHDRKVFQDGNKQSEEDLRKAAVDASYDLRKAYQEVDTLAGKIIGDGEMHIKDFCGNEHGVLNVNSGGDINITAAKGDIKIEATRVNEKNKTGEGQANNDITITADNITLKAGTIKLLGDIQVLSKSEETLLQLPRTRSAFLQGNGRQRPVFWTAALPWTRQQELQLLV